MPCSCGEEGGRSPVGTYGYDPGGRRGSRSLPPGPRPGDSVEGPGGIESKEDETNRFLPTTIKRRPRGLNPPCDAHNYFSHFC